MKTSPDPAVKILGRESLPPGLPPKDRSEDSSEENCANVLVEQLLSTPAAGTKTKGD